MATTLENANPTIFQQKKEREILPEEEDEDIVDEIDEREVFDILFEAPTYIVPFLCKRLVLDRYQMSEASTQL